MLENVTKSEIFHQFHLLFEVLPLFLKNKSWLIPTHYK